MGMTAEELEALLEENENLRETNAALSDENTSLQNDLAGRGDGGGRHADLCWPCEKKRRWLAIICGGNLGLAWWYAFPRWGHEYLPPAFFQGDVELWFGVILGVLALGPILGVIIAWKLTLFGRSQVWKRWRIYRAWQAFRAPAK